MVIFVAFVRAPSGMTTVILNSRDQNLNRLFQMWTYKLWIEWDDLIWQGSDDLSWWCLCWCSPASCWLPLLQQHCLLTLSLSTSTPSSYPWSCSPDGYMLACALSLDYVFQVQGLTFLLVELHEGLVSPLFQTTQVLVLSDSLCPSVHCPASLLTIANFIRAHWIQFQITYFDMEQHWALYSSLGVSTSGRMSF